MDEKVETMEARGGGDAVDPERVGALSLEDGLVDHLVGEDFLSNKHHRVTNAAKSASQQPRDR